MLLPKRFLQVLSVSVHVVALSSAAFADDVFPDAEWQRAASPEAVGWSGELLDAARDYASTINTAAVVIVDGGVVVDAWGQLDAKFNVHSIRKSLLSAMIGIYEADGTLDLTSTLEELGIDDRDSLTRDERQATLDDILGSRSGVYHPSNLVGAEHSSAWPARGSHAPGTHWYYSNWDFNVAGAIFEQETGRGIFDAFAELIATPTGMTAYQRTDGMYEPRSGWGGAQGRSVSDYPAYVFRMTAWDMARFGLLYLREGRWKGQQVVPRDWIARTTMTTRPVNEFGGHEYFWWIAVDGRLYPDVDVGDGAYAAHGAGGHYITVMPEFDTVVVHRVNTNDRTIPVGGVDEGTRVTRAEYGKLLGLILKSRAP